MGQIHPFPGDAYVFIVDDDKSVSDALALLLRLEGFATQSFSDGYAFLEAVRLKPPACVILDLQLPGYSGLDVLRDLAEMRFAPPVIAISGHSDVPTAVTAMKRGALDFMEKPFAASVMADRVREAVLAYLRAADGPVSGFGEFSGRHLLTSREREGLGQVANGASNKEAGRRLGISPRTIEVHRARIMAKLGAKNAADLIRIVLSKERRPPRSMAT